MASPDAGDRPTAPNASTALARVLVDELARGGMAHAVLSPGSRSTALALAFEADARVRLHVSLDERSASFVAIGLARSTGRAAAVVTTSGSAVANLHPAVVEADHGNVPLLLLTADRPPSLRGTAANQTIEQVGIFGDSVRWAFDVGVPDDHPGANAYWRSTVSQAWARAHGLGGPAGPVHLNLAFREPTVPHTDDGRTTGTAFHGNLDGRRDGRMWTSVQRQVTPGDGQAKVIADRLRTAKRGLVLLGQGSYVPAPVTQVARAGNVPIIAEPFSNGRRGDSGIAHAHLLVAAGLVDPPDSVVRVGRTGVSRAVERWLTSDVEQVLVDPDGAFLDPARAIGDIVVADADVCLARAAAALREDPPAGPGWLEAWRERDAEVSAIIDEVFEAGPLSGPSVARALVAAAPQSATIVVASSAPVRDVDAYAPLREDLRMVGNRGASGIDGFTSTVLGVALGHDGITLGLAGDLSFLHDTNGWLLRADGGDGTSEGSAFGGPDVVMVVVDNDGGGLFHQLPVASEPAFERLFGTPHGIDLSAVAAAHGLTVHQPATMPDLLASVASACEARGRHVVHVRTDRQQEAAQRREVLDRVRKLARVRS